MAYRFRLKEPLESGMRRIAGEQLDAALKARPLDDTALASWVHETRKGLKRIRALLRLVQTGLDIAERRALNAELRRIGRLLSPLRDRHVLASTVQTLTAESPAPHLARAANWLQKKLILEPGLPHLPLDPGDALSDEERISAALESLEAAHERLQQVRAKGRLVDVAAEGLAKSHRTARRALAIAEDTRTDEAMHDLRKALQTSWRHAKLLAAAWPEVAEIRIATAREVSQVLGTVQDLAVLAAVATKSATTPREADHAATLGAAADERQKHLYAQAFPLADRLLALPPSLVADEFTACWRASVRQAREKKRVAAAARTTTARRQKTTKPKNND